MNLADRHEHFDHEEDLDHCPQCGSAEIFYVDHRLTEECEECGFKR